jgi:dipeptidyl aminopeptidase/acylaminoacyl peptidase
MSVAMREDLPAAVVDALDEPPPPAVLVSPDAAHVALVHRRASSRWSIVGRPFRLIGGERIDTRSYAPHRPPPGQRVTIVSRRDGTTTTVGAADGDAVWPVGFSADSTRFAFAVFRVDRIDLVWVDCRTYQPHRADARLNGTGLALGQSLAEWMGAEARILCRLVCDGGGTTGETVEDERPLVYDTARGDGAVRWWSGLLETDADERALRRYFTNQLASVDPLTGDVRSIGSPDLITQALPSPDGRYLLVQRIEPPLARLTLVGELATTAEIWDAQSGLVLRRLWNARSDGGRTFDPRDRRAWGWNPAKPATIAWSERQADRSETLFTCAAPFDSAPAETLRLRKRQRVDWTTGGRLLAWEHDAARGLMRLRVECEGSPHGAIAWEGPLDQVTPMPLRLRTGTSQAIVQDGDAFFVTGVSIDDGYARPFLDGIAITGGVRTRVFESTLAVPETVVAAVPGQGTMLLVTQREAQDLRVETSCVDLRSGDRRIVDQPRSGVSVITGAERIPVSYPTRGITHSTIVYRPAGTDAASARPLLLWLHPDIDGYDYLPKPIYRNQFLRRRGVSPFVLLERGCAVVDTPPLTLDGSCDSLADDLVDHMASLVGTLVAQGIADPRRVAIGGYCLGGWAAATLLARTDLFCAGILCTGYYDVTRRPLGGLLTGGRRFWDVPEIFMERSPLYHVDRITAPVLVIHCEEESASVDRKDDSRRLFDVLAGLGRTARYVRVPYDGHYYEARESLLMVAGEMRYWCDAHITRDATLVAGACEPVAAGAERA